VLKILLETILDFQISQGSVVTHLRWGGSLYNRSIENFLRNLKVKEMWKSLFICRSYYQKTNWLFFWNTVYTKVVFGRNSRHSSEPQSDGEGGQWRIQDFILGV